MKTSLIAMAVFATLSGTALAQNNAIVYGVVDIGLVREDNGLGRQYRMDSGYLNGSRLGFKGTEDLGNGVTAAFQIESGLNVDSGTTGAKFWGRQAWVGLNTNVGSVKFGRQQNGFFMNSETFDPFGNALAGDSQRLLNYFGARADNVISYGYESHGLRGQVQYGFGEVANNAAANRMVTAWGGYTVGGLDTVLVYEKNNDATNTTSARTTLLGGNYNFKVVQVFATYAWNKGVDGVGVNSRDALVGLRVPVGSAGAFMASYIRKSNKDVDNADADQVALGYTHDLSKRTALYASASRVSNDSTVSYDAGAPGATDKLYMVGVRHRF